jgi:hypothetical protein
MSEDKNQENLSLKLLTEEVILSVITNKSQTRNDLVSRLREQGYQMDNMDFNFLIIKLRWLEKKKKIEITIDGEYRLYQGSPISN